MAEAEMGTETETETYRMLQSRLIVPPSQRIQFHNTGDTISIWGPPIYRATPSAHTNTDSHRRIQARTQTNSTVLFTEK